MSTNAEKGKRFRRWLTTGNAKRLETIESAILLFLPPLESIGFKWIDKCSDGGTVPPHTIYLERSVSDRFDYVQFIFDKHHRARFQVSFGSKEKKSPYRWIRSGALVWRRGSDSVKYKWWGARWWSLNPEKVLLKSIESVASLLPQSIEFLSEGVSGSNVWTVAITNSTAD